MDPVTIEDYKGLLDDERKISAELGEMNQALRKQNGALEAERDRARDKALEDAAEVAYDSGGAEIENIANMGPHGAQVVTAQVISDKIRAMKTPSAGRRV